MATTWTTFLSSVRAELNDTSSTTPKWSDDLLYLWVLDAIRDYSQYFPQTIDQLELTLSGASYPVPSDYLRVVFVEAPEGRFLRTRRARPGRRYYTSTGTPSHYHVDGNTLKINGAADELLLTYHAIHGVPTDVNDTAFPFTVPDRDIELIRLYVRAKAHEQMRSMQSAQDRYKLGSGSRDDNPLLPEVENLMESYDKKIAERYEGGTIMLQRVR
jgi:hypothetical protein